MTLEVSIWHLISLFYQMARSIVLIQCKTFILNSQSDPSSRPAIFELRRIKVFVLTDWFHSIIDLMRVISIDESQFYSGILRQENKTKLI